MTTDETTARLHEPVVRFVASVTRRAPLGFVVPHGISSIGGTATDDEEFAKSCMAFLQRIGDGDVYSVSVDRTG